jgi:hypothetical protein
MTVRERLLALHLAEKLEKNPQYANKIGVRLLERGSGFCEEKGRERNDV